MVFQDGLQYNAPVVFDNLIHKKTIPPMVGVFVMHGRVQGAVGRRARSDEPQLRVRLGERRLRALPARRDAAARREDARPDAVDRSERSRDCGQQQRRDRGVRRGVAAAGRVPPRLQRDRHLRRPARRQRVPGADPQDRAQADPHLPAGRAQRSEQLHRQLVHRQPGHARRRSSTPATTCATNGATASTTRGTPPAIFPQARRAGCGATGRRRSRPTRRASRRRTSSRC